MTEFSPRIALVVSTRNRAKRLDSFFESISRLEYERPWEIILIDNGSTDGTAERLRNFAALSAVKVTVITELTPGLSKAHNRGWQATKAPIIAFTDDDCYPDSNFLKVIEILFSDPSLGFLGGRLLLYDPSDARVSINENPAEILIKPNDFLPAGCIQGANMAFRREALEQIGGFDENIGSGTPFVFGDVDAALRVLASGREGRYDPRLVVYHHHGRKPGLDVNLVERGYGTGRGAYYVKCILFMPQRWKTLLFWLRSIKKEPIRRTFWEVVGGVHYIFYLSKRSPNIAY